MSVINSVKDSVTHSAVPAVGEIFGPELVTGTDSDMSGPNNWLNTGLAVLNINTTVADKLYMLGDGGNEFARLLNLITIGKDYQVSLKARLNAGASTAIRFGSGLVIAGDFTEFTPTGTEANFKGNFSATSTTIRLGLATGFAGIAFEIDDVSVREIL